LSRAPRITRLAVATAIGALSLGGGDALAATGSLSGTSTLLYVGDKGEANDVTVAQAGRTITFTDTGAPVTPGAGCTAVDPHSIACAATGVTALSVSGADGADRLVNDTSLPAQLAGGSEPDVLVGGSGPDALNGGAGGDTLDGRAGPDAFDGGGGTDLADYSSRTTGLAVSLDGSADDGAKLEGDKVPASVENVTGGSGKDTLRGSSAANRLDGGAGDDTLDGDTGPDQLVGGGGADTATYASRQFPLSLTLDGAANDGAAGEADLLGDDVENLIAGHGDDTLAGNAADNVLDGGLGDDAIGGGAGDDTVTYATRTARVEVWLGTLIPEGQAGEADNVADDVEGAIGGAGDDLMRDFTILPGRHFAGGGGADTLIGGAGGMVLDGGADDDFVGGGVGADTMAGGPGDDHMSGIVGDDVLDGGAGDDVITGGAGADLVRGGADDDDLNGDDFSHLVDAAADDLQGGPGVDLVRYTRVDDLTLRLNDVADDGAPGEGDNLHTDVEAVVSGNGADELIGSPAGETLDGGPGNDAIDGRGGPDELRGGQGGDDILAVDGIADSITCGGQAADSVAFDQGIDIFPLADC
jgi:Ca2+-binding RTX toxin-like protein